MEELFAAVAAFFVKIDWQLVAKGFRESLYMTLVSSAFAYAIGLPLGVVLAVTDSNGLRPVRWISTVLGVIINVLRSIPFLILLILVIPVTRAIVGTMVGSTATIVPLTISAAPFIARVVESSLKEVDAGVIQASRSMGASPMQIIWKVLLAEARPSLLVGASITVTTILAYSAMAGAVGGGGLGDVAIRYGYYRYQKEMMFTTVALLVVIVQVFQEVAMRLVRRVDRRL
ncbi:MAG: ABC transporter permease [Oscillospiraceae bacterium]|jgi:D-methionine transport system permease protein|nr:ABC transporter permease [Oscillospiraceae bacterium]